MSNVRITREFGLTVKEAENVESIVRTVLPEYQAILRMAIVIGIGEMAPGKPFQDIANRIVSNYGSEGV